MNERLRWWRWTDLCLCALLLLSAAGIGLRARYGVRSPLSGDAVDVRLLWRDVDRRTAECLSVGEELYSEAGARFGSVMSVEAVPAVRVWKNGSVELFGSARNDPRYDVYLVVSVRLVSDGGLLRREDGRPLALGTRFVLFGDRCRVEGVVV